MANTYIEVRLIFKTISRATYMKFINVASHLYRQTVCFVDEHPRQDPNIRLTSTHEITYVFQNIKGATVELTV